YLSSVGWVVWVEVWWWRRGERGVEGGWRGEVVGVVDRQEGGGGDGVGGGIDDEGGEEEGEREGDVGGEAGRAGG
ncbi:hypothetical protein, partial [Kocuria rosea]|uniref:hypothetical protein n=1 Tax=Kocuria rosea TaxID=1275 RepID=UPI001C9305D1